jgi:transposase, IS6 family
VKVAGRWDYVYRAVDQHGQIIDVYVSARRDTTSARRFFETAFGAHGEPVEVVTDRAPALRAVIKELMPAAFHNSEQYANNRIEADHGRLKARLRPMRGLKRDRTARVIIRGHALMQNIRRGHYEPGATAATYREDTPHSTDQRDNDPRNPAAHLPTNRKSPRVPIEQIWRAVIRSTPSSRTYAPIADRLG